MRVLVLTFFFCFDLVFTILGAGDMSIVQHRLAPSISWPLCKSGSSSELVWPSTSDRALIGGTKANNFEARDVFLKAESGRDAFILPDVAATTDRPSARAH